MTTKLKKYVIKHWIIFIIFLGIPLILLIGYFYAKFSFRFLDYLDRENKKYTIVQTKDQFTGIIDSVYSSHGSAFVSLKDSTKIWFEVSENKMYDTYLLCDFLRPNDSLSKKFDNDTLFVFRNQGSYFFKLGLNNSKKDQK